MSNTLKVACVQMTSGPNMEENLKQAESLIEEAAKAGATFIATPENTDYILSKPAQKVENGYHLDEHPALPFFAGLAKKLSVHILLGSIAVKDVVENRLYNRSFLFTPGGEIAASYDKMHLFDVDLPTGESHRESHYFIGGDRAVVADLGPVKLGMSICYDLRFAYLYRALAHNGAGILSVPSAFTVPTGKAHWHVLLRARAIETGCFVIAPAQVGEHDGGRKTYGHSIIINPWGQVLAQQEEGTGVVVAELNLDQIEKARQAIPALQHDSEFAVIKG